MSQALYRKWRPRLWEQVVGQEHVVVTLKNAIAAGRVGHAYLFAGPRGTGKTTTARLLAKAVNCLAESPAERPCDHCQHCQAVNDNRFLDLIEIDAASNTSVDDVRDLRDKINFSPSQGKYKVYIIDEVHMLSTAAFNALLKTLEEPPPHAIFILATTEVHKIPATVLSRCQRHEFRRIPVADIVRHLQELCTQEGLQVDKDALTLIARQATGSLRDAISLLDQLTSGGQVVNLATAQTVLGTAASQRVFELIDAVLARNPSAGMDCIAGALDSGSDPRQFARQVVDTLRNLLLVRMGAGSQMDVTADQREQMARQAQAFSLPQLLEAVRLFNAAANEMRSGWQPGLPLELALAQTIQSMDAPPAAAPAASPAEAVVLSAKSPVSETPVTRTRQSAAEPAPAAQKPAAVTPSPVSSPESPPISTAKPGEISQDDIKKNWKKIKEAVSRRNKMTGALLNSAKTITLREGILVIGFVGPVLKTRMDNEETRKIIIQSIREVLGVDIPVTGMLVNDKGESLSRDESIETGGIVDTALDMGGKIVQKE